jgi:hypothetical protein
MRSVAWLLWTVAGVAMEYDGGGTFSHWAATRDDVGFAAIIGLLGWLIAHLVGQRFDCFGLEAC